MKLPRGVSAERLVRTLEKLGYKVTRQKGSHLRLRYDAVPPHSLTVPMHHQLKTGTLHGIVSEIAQVRGVTVDSILEMLE